MKNPGFHAMCILKKKKIFRADTKFEFFLNADVTIEGVRIKEGFFSGNIFKNPYFQAQCDPHSDINLFFDVIAKPKLF